MRRGWKDRRTLSWLAALDRACRPATDRLAPQCHRSARSMARAHHERTGGRSRVRRRGPLGVHGLRRRRGKAADGRRARGERSAVGMAYGRSLRCRRSRCSGARVADLAGNASRERTATRIAAALRTAALEGRNADGLLDAARYLGRRRALVLLASDFHFELAFTRRLLAALAAHFVVPVVVWDAAETAGARRPAGSRSPTAKPRRPASYGCGRSSSIASAPRWPRDGIRSRRSSAASACVRYISMRVSAPNG